MGPGPGLGWQSAMDTELPGNPSSCTQRGSGAHGTLDTFILCPVVYEGHGELELHPEQRGGGRGNQGEVNGLG